MRMHDVTWTSIVWTLPTLYSTLVIFLHYIIKMRNFERNTKERGVDSHDCHTHSNEEKNRAKE